MDPSKSILDALCSLATLSPATSQKSRTAFRRPVNERGFEAASDPDCRRLALCNSLNNRELQSEWISPGLLVCHRRRGRDSKTFQPRDRYATVQLRFICKLDQELATEKLGTT